MEKWYIIRCATNKEKESRDKIENKLKYTDFLLDKIKKIKNEDDLYYFATSKVADNFLPEKYTN